MHWKKILVFSCFTSLPSLFSLCFLSYPCPVILCILCHTVVSLTRFNAVSEDEFIPPWALARFDVTALGSKERKKAELWGFSVAQSSSSLHSASSSQVTHLSVRSPSPCILLSALIYCNQQSRTWSLLFLFTFFLPFPPFLSSLRGC